VIGEPAAIRREGGHQLVESTVHEGIRLIHARNGPCFPVKTLSQFCSAGEMIRQDFNGYNTVESRIAGAVNLSHSACANCREDFVRPEALAGANCHWSHQMQNWANYITFALRLEGAVYCRPGM
jgi:hypothetical protein